MEGGGSKGGKKGGRKEEVEWGQAREGEEKEKEEGEKVKMNKVWESRGGKTEYTESVNLKRAHSHTDLTIYLLNLLIIFSVKWELFLNPAVPTGYVSSTLHIKRNLQEKLNTESFIPLFIYWSEQWLTWKILRDPVKDATRLPAQAVVSPKLS